MKRYFLLTVLTTLLFGSNAYGTENDPTKLNRWDLIFPYKGLAKITLNTLASAFNSSDDNDFSPTNFSTSANVNNTKIVSNHIGSKTIETEKTVDNSTVLDSQKTLQNNTQKIPTTIVKPNEDLENFAKKFKISLKDSDYKHKNKKMVKKHISNIQLLIEEYKVNPPFSDYVHIIV